MTTLEVRPGPAVLAGIERGPSLAAHRSQYGDLPRPGLDELLALVESAAVRGRGGAAFPFATKLRTAARGRRRPVVVVNLAEGEPASSKDTALALTRPHLVIDGAVVTARALGAREVHVVLPGERPQVVDAVTRALAERDDRVRTSTHVTSGRFVAGQARAVVELVSGRDGLPVTGWVPEPVSGVGGRPTLLSNAETWAHVARWVLLGQRGYAGLGTPGEPGTTLLTWSLAGAGTAAATSAPATVLEVPFGSRFRDVLPPAAADRPVLVGGYHGAWATWDTLASARVSVPQLRQLGVPLGAGVVLSAEECPVDVSLRIVSWLAGQSAGRCGPCTRGLPALAAELTAAASGTGDLDRVRELAGLVTGRGACAHPDGTARLVRSVLTAWPEELAEHARGGCTMSGAGTCQELAS